MEKILNKAQVQEIFDKASILIGSNDVVPLYLVEDIFGSKAAAFAYRPGETGNCFGIEGEYNLPYLNYKGFQLAASYCNVERIRVELNDGKENVA